MLIVWGRGNSVNVQKVLWCCEELALACERVDAGGVYGVVDTPPYRQLNPNGLVPTLVDDDFVLWESNAIVRYLAGGYGDGVLWPGDRRVRAQADQWMDWWASTFWPAIRPLFMGLIRTPPEKRDAGALAESRRKTAEVLAIFEDHLAQRRYVAGDSFTIGDIPMGCGIWRWMSLPVERPEMPNVKRWFDLLAARPAYRKIVMHPLT